MIRREVSSNDRFLKILFLVLLVGLLGYLFRDIFPWRSWIQSTITHTGSSSPWFDKQKRIYDNALAQGRFDIVVAPVSAEPESLDRVSRSLISRYVAEGLRQRTQYSLPDTSWVIHALGEYDRVIPESSAKALADKVGARYLLTSTVSRPKEVFSYDLAMTVFEHEKGSFGDSWKVVARIDWRDIEFSDQQPPEESLRLRLGDLLQETRIPLGEPGPVDDASRQLNYEQQELHDFAKVSKPTTIDNALALQVYASLYPQIAFEQELVWERSLVALEGADSRTPLYRLLRARANMHLHRRPFALQILGEPQTEAEKAFFGYMQGNIHQAETHSYRIEDPLLGMISKIESDTLRRSYGRGEGYTARSEQLARILPTWSDLVYTRMSTVSWFDDEFQNKLAQRMAAEGYAIDDPSPGELDLWWSVLLANLGIHRNQSVPYVDGLRAVRLDALQPKIWADKSAQWTKQDGDTRLQEWDYFELLLTASRYSIQKDLYTTTSYQHLFERAEQKVKVLDEAFAGHPLMVSNDALVSWLEQRDRRYAEKKEKLRERVLRLAMDLHRWQPGETELSRTAEWYFYELNHLNYGKYYDEPMRWDRRYMGKSPSRFGHISKGDERWRRAVAYTFNAFDAMSLFLNKLRREGRLAEGEAVLAANRDRFVGSPLRSRFIVDNLRRLPDERAVPLIRQELEADPNDWDMRVALAERQMRIHQFAEAQATILAQPNLQLTNEEGVGKTNALARFARKMALAGGIDYAIPVFRKAASYDNGAENDFNSREQIAVYENKIDEAYQWAKASYDRYNTAAEKLRMVEYLFLLGQENKAWQLHNEYIHDRNSALPKFETGLGLRLNGQSRAQVLERIDQWAASDNPNIPSWRLETIYFITFVVGAMPTEEDIANIAQLNDRFSKSPLLRGWFAGYAHYRRGEYEKALPNLKVAMDLLVNDSKRMKKPVNYAMAYYVQCLARLGRFKEATEVWQHSGATEGQGFFYLLAGATIEGLQGHYAVANQYLDKAYQTRFAFKRYKPIPVGLQMIEVVEQLNRSKPQPVYYALIRKIADEDYKRELWWWAPMVSAQYDVARQADPKFLARAIFLDPNSYRLQKMKPVHVRNARSWLGQNKPYN